MYCRLTNFKKLWRVAATLLRLDGLGHKADHDCLRVGLVQCLYDTESFTIEGQCFGEAAVL